MTRILAALLALTAAAATLSVSTPAPAQADGGTYLATTQIAFEDAMGDAPPPSDLQTSHVSLDPNSTYYFADTVLGGWSSQPSFVVMRLGELVAGSCEIRLEVVSNREDDELLRAPGETTLPREGAGYENDEDVVLLWSDRRFDGLVPTCAVLDLIDRDGLVLDTVDGVVTNTPAGRGTLEISHDPDAILNADSGEKTTLEYQVATTTGPVYDVTVDAVPGDAGLVLPRTHFVLGDLSSDFFRRRRLNFTATPGLHTLTLRLSGGNAPTSEVTVTIWGRGGPALARRDSLQGRAFFLEQDDIETHRYTHWRRWVAYSFLDDTWVRRSYRDTLTPTQPAPYLPCTRVSATCLRYSYDARSGAVQVGKNRGELRDGALRIDGVQDHAAQPAAVGSTVAFVGRNRNVTRKRTVGRAEFLLTLREDGTFTRVTQLYEFQKHPVTQRGRYRIGQDGLLIARTSTGRVLRTGLAFVLDARGEPQPQQLGIYAFDVWFRPMPR